MILNGRKLVEILPLNDLYTVYKEHRRLKVFVHKGRNCVVCDREGVLLLVTEEKNGTRHVDLYTDDFVLMTVDHIVPKAVCKKIGWSRAARERLTNKQTMCDPCNGKKGSKDINNDELREIRCKNGYPQRVKGVEIIRELVYNTNIFNREVSIEQN